VTVLGNLVLLAVLAGLATVLYFVVSRGPTERFTEFYVLGPQGKVADYPTQVRAGQEVTLILGVVNHEGRPQAYKLLALMGGLAVVAQDIPTIPDGQRWERAVTFTVPKIEGRTRIDFQLFREGDVQPYRRLHLWVEVLP